MYAQVLVSIQSMIFVNDTYFNEPGYESTRKTSTMLGLPGRPCSMLFWAPCASPRQPLWTSSGEQPMQSSRQLPEAPKTDYDLLSL